MGIIREIQIMNCQKQKDKKIKRDKKTGENNFFQKRILEMKINETENQIKNENIKGGKTKVKIEK